MTTAPQSAAARDTSSPNPVVSPPVPGELSSHRRRFGRGVEIAGCHLLMLSTLAAAAVAQRPTVEVYSAGDGLPSSIIFDLEQDPSGRLWILSRGGVSVYDGVTFENHAEGLPLSPLGALAIDAAGEAWTVTLEHRRPFVFDGDSWQALPVPPVEHRPNDWATELAAISSETGSRLVIGTTASGLLIWDGESWHQLTAADGLPADRVNDLAPWGDRVYVATGAGPCLLTGLELDCRMRQLDPRLRRRTFAILPAGGTQQDREPHRLFILGAEWMGCLEDGVLTVLAEGLDLRAYDFSILGDLAVDEAGGIYFGSPGELYYLGPERERLWKKGPRQGLAANGTTALLRDRESNLWIGSLRGLSKISSQRFLSYGQDQGLLENEVSAIAEIAPGRLIFGHEGGLTFLDPDRIETLSFPRDEDQHPQLGLPALGSPAPDAPYFGRQLAFRVLDIAIDRRGEVWLAAHDFGLAHLTAERTVEVEPLAGRFFTVEMDSQGKLWAATQEQLYVREESRFVEVDCGIGLDEIGFYRWFHAGGDGRFYLATRSGLLWREESGWRIAHGPSDQASNVYNVHAESDGTVWAATGAGLYRLEGERLVQADLGGQSLDRPAYLLLGDPSGQLWIGTDDGVMVWDRRRLRQFTIRHGLAGRETNRGAGLVDHRGQVWIGTDQGASVYRQPYDLSPEIPPGVELRTLEVDGRASSPAADLELRHDQNQLLFHVGTIGFDDEEAVRLRYRLDGLDADWHSLTAAATSEIRYTNLASGRYRLRVAAGRGEGPWSSEAISGAITIARPFWRTIWFYAAAAAAIGLALAGAHSLRVRTISKHNRRLQAEIAERQRAETERGLLIDDLQTKNRELERFTYTVSHDLKTPLVTILGFLGLLRRDTIAGDDEKIDRDLEHIESAAKKMGRLLDELLELSRLGRVSFERQPVRLAEIVREAVDMLAAVIAERGVEVTVADDLPVVEGERMRLLEVMQNLVDNAIKFLGDQPSPRIQIGVRNNADGMEVILVRDNGIGIEPHYQEKIFGLFDRLDPAIEGTGVGLAIVQRIVELHGGRIWVESEGLGHGATFCWTLPGCSAPPEPADAEADSPSP